MRFFGHIHEFDPQPGSAILAEDEDDIQDSETNDPGKTEPANSRSRSVATTTEPDPDDRDP